MQNFDDQNTSTLKIFATLKTSPKKETCNIERYITYYLKKNVDDYTVQNNFGLWPGLVAEMILVFP